MFCEQTDTASNPAVHEMIQRAPPIGFALARHRALVDVGAPRAATAGSHAASPAGAGVRHG